MLIVSIGAGGVSAACAQEDPKALIGRSGFLGMVQDGEMRLGTSQLSPSRGAAALGCLVSHLQQQRIMGDVPKRHKILQEDAFSAKVLTQHNPCFLTRSNV